MSYAKLLCRRIYTGLAMKFWCWPYQKSIALGMGQMQSTAIAVNLPKDPLEAIEEYCRRNVISLVGKEPQ